MLSMSRSTRSSMVGRVAVVKGMLVVAVVNVVLLWVVAFRWVGRMSWRSTSDSQDEARRVQREELQVAGQGQRSYQQDRRHQPGAPPPCGRPS